MKILITGQRGLAYELGQVYAPDHSVYLVSKSNGFDINRVDVWGSQFLDHDCVFNCAYDGFGQVKVLEFFYQHWQHDHTKSIITIGSRAVTFPRTEGEQGYWPYRLHKQALQQAHDAMLCYAKCHMTIINPGPIDTDMIRHVDCAKFDAGILANKIQQIVSDASMKRVDLWL